MCKLLFKITVGHFPLSMRVRHVIMNSRQHRVNRIGKAVIVQLSNRQYQLPKTFPNYKILTIFCKYTWYQQGLLSLIFGLLSAWKQCMKTFRFGYRAKSMQRPKSLSFKMEKSWGNTSSTVQWSGEWRIGVENRVEASRPALNWTVEIATFIVFSTVAATQTGGRV